MAYFAVMDLASNFEKVRERIAAACARAKRVESEVMLVAVSKSQPPEAITELANAGQLIFAENRVQEAKAKIPLCSGRLQWHMIGHLQSNKCRDAAALFQMVQSVDSLALAEELDKAAEKQSKTIPILLEVNVAGENTKFGFKPAAVLANLDALNALKRLEIHGLMTIAPYTSDLETVRPIFRQLRELKAKCETALGAPLPHLSMGMSGDYEVAIEEGATIVRIGTALFGPRQYAKAKLRNEAEPE